MTRSGPLIVMAALLSLAAPASAQDLPDLGEARDLVFAEDGAIEWGIVPFDFLSDADLATLDQINRIQPQAYYAAMAIAPDQGLAANTTALAANYHDEDNARAAALAECEANRSGGPRCQVVMVIRPQGWEPGRPLQLSTEAAAALNTQYRQLPRRGRAFAISPSTGLWGIGESREAAMAACGAADCAVVIEG